MHHSNAAAVIVHDGMLAVVRFAGHWRLVLQEPFWQQDQRPHVVIAAHAVGVPALKEHNLSSGEQYAHQVRG